MIINTSVMGFFFILCFAFTSLGMISNSEEVSKENLPKLAVANNELAWNLFRNFASNSTENVFFSPFSISTAFGMLFYGTRNETAEELRNALGYENANLPSDLVHQTFNSFLNDILNTVNSSAGYVLNAANAVYVDKEFEVLEEYKTGVEELYKAAVRDVDFAGNTSETVEEINSWVREKTNGKIEKLFDTLSPSTLMVLLNAVYFKGTWKTQFNPEETREDIFYNNGQELEAKRVPMMHMTSRFLCASLNDIQALQLPYKGEKVAMLILLPDKRDGLQTLEESFTNENFTRIQEQMTEIKLDIYLPKFKLEFEEELSRKMQALGANKIFNVGADLSGMISSNNVSASISEVRHKAVMEVNEEGSEAAAATGILIDRKRPAQFRADHPFLFVIVEKSSNMILFMGRVNNL